MHLQSASKAPWDPGVLPPALEKLADVSVPLNLPQPHPRYRLLARKPVDQLIRAIGSQPTLWPRVLALTRFLAACEFTYDARMCESIITVLANNKQHRRAHQVYSWMRSSLRLRASPSTYTVAMKSALAGDQVSVARQIWHDAIADGVRRDTKLVCTYMSVLLRARHHRQLLQLYDEMRTERRPGGVPLHACALAMRAHTQLGQPAEALALFRQLKKKRWGPNASSAPLHTSDCMDIARAHTSCMLTRVWHMDNQLIERAFHWRAAPLCTLACCSVETESLACRAGVRGCDLSVRRDA